MITRIIEKEGDQLAHLMESMRENISETGYELARAYLDQRSIDESWDRDALVVVLLGGLINLRRSTWTYGKPPLGLSDERVLATWVELCLTVIAN